MPRKGHFFVQMNEKIFYMFILMSIYIKINPAINRGSYGITYYANKMGEDKDKIYVIKEIDIKSTNLGQLYMEIESLKYIRDNTCRNDILCFKEYYVDYERQMFNIVTESFIKHNKLPINLREFLNKNTILDENTILKIIFNTLSGFNYLHNINVGHGDIKPENILIHENTHDIQIIDFGYSCTKECKVGGTIAYESPEMLEMKLRDRRIVSREFQRESDIFSLGILYYEVINRKLPIEKIFGVKNMKKENVIKELINIYKKGEIKTEYKNEYINIIINKMLKYDSKERPKMEEIYKYIKKMYMNEILDEDEIMDVVMSSPINNM
jgi:serine/threonine protein kinase